MNGTRKVARFDVKYVGPDLGGNAAVMGSHGNTFTDGYQAPEPSVFNGEYLETGGGATGGIGYGFGSASIGRGASTGSLTGLNAGFGVGLYEIGGQAELIWERDEVCDDNCDE